MTDIKTVYTYTLDGVQTEFAVPFDYLARRFVEVTLIGKTRQKLTLSADYRFLSPKVIKTVKAWGQADGFTYMEIRRFTSATDVIVDFSDGSILRANDLNTANLQAMQIAEEARSVASETIGVNDDGDLDARGRKIVNLGEGRENKEDAVTMKFIKTTENDIINLRDQVQQLHDETEIYRNEAEGFKGSAKTSEINAKTSETLAKGSENQAKRYADSMASSVSQSAANAQAASRSASEAATSASRASSSQSEAEDSARRAAASAAQADGIPRSNLVQTTGSGVDKVISQNTVTNELNKRVLKDNPLFTSNVVIQTSNDTGIQLETGSKKGLLLHTADGTWKVGTKGTEPSWAASFQKKSGDIALTSDIPKLPSWRTMYSGTGVDSYDISVVDSDKALLEVLFQKDVGGFWIAIMARPASQWSSYYGGSDVRLEVRPVGSVWHLAPKGAKIREVNLYDIHN